MGHLWWSIALAIQISRLQLPTFLSRGAHDISSYCISKNVNIQDALQNLIFDVAYAVKDNSSKWISAACSIHKHARICYKTKDGHLNSYLSSGRKTLHPSMFAFLIAVTFG
jgi:hypothetical protein